MEITLKLLQSLQERGSELDSPFPGVAGIIGGPQFPRGSELQEFDENGFEVQDENGIAKRIEKESVSLHEKVTICTSDKDTAETLYKEFKEKYQDMLSAVEKRFELHKCDWINTCPSVMKLPLHLKVNEEFKAWNDPLNRISYYVSEDINTDKEEVTLNFFFEAWPCNNPKQAATKRDLGASYPVMDNSENIANELAEENEKNGFVDGKEMSKEEMKEKLKEKFKVVE